MYAINVVAMLNVSQSIEHLPLFMLLKGVVTGEVVQPLPGMGHEALLVRSDVAADRWQAICQIVRKKFSYPEFPLYEKGDSGWKTIR